jgi:hypothetical protein
MTNEIYFICLYAGNWASFQVIKLAGVTVMAKKMRSLPFHVWDASPMLSHLKSLAYSVQPQCYSCGAS